MREATDLGIGAAVRRELAGRRIDLSKIKFPVKAGVVTLQGELDFVGMVKTTDETAIELKFIESSLRKIAGVKDTIFELENWSINDSGVWESSNQPPATAHTASGAGVASGEGLYCDDCDMVIRFCPCCGKPLTTSARSAARPRRTVPPVKAMIKKKKPVFIPPAPTTSPLPPVIGEAPDQKEPIPVLPKPIAAPSPMKQAPAQPIAAPIIAEEAPAIPTVPVAPAVPAVSAIPAVPVVPAVKLETPTKPPEKPAVPAPPVKPIAPAVKPEVAAPSIPITKEPETVTPTVTVTPVPVAPVKPITPAPAPILVAKPALPPQSTTAVPPIQPIPEKPAADEMNLDNLNLNLDGVNSEEPAVPKPDFMKSDELNEDLFGSLIDNLSQSGSDSSAAQAESDNFTQDPASASEGIPDINLDSLDNFSGLAPEAPAPDQAIEDITDLLPPMKPAAVAAPLLATEDFTDDIADLLPPMKPAATPSLPATEDFSDDIADLLPPMKPSAKQAPVKPAPVQKPDPFAGLDDDTPLPPMRPADTADSDDDDDTPLPPMRPKAPARKENKDPFAALFSEADLGLGSDSSDGGAKDPFANLDLDLDVLEVFPSDDQPALPPPTAKPPADDNPFNIDNIIDLDSPVEDKPKAGKKPAKDPFDLDDFDIDKFKL